jgi:hypothetical protein
MIMVSTGLRWIKAFSQLLKNLLNNYYYINLVSVVVINRKTKGSALFSYDI